MTVGENIKRIRKEKGLTQKQLGSLCGINEVQIRRYELGGKNANPKLETIRKIADALNVPISEILSYDNMVGNVTPSGDIIYIDSDILEYNRIIDKQKSGNGYTPYDIKFIGDYIKKDAHIRDWFVVNGLKSHEENLYNIQKAYERLNDAGQKEARKRVEELTEIPRYTKPDKPQ